MQAQIDKVSLQEIGDLRELSLREYHFQFVHDKCYGAGWSDTYLFSIGKEPIGFGSVWGKDDRQARDTIFDFYLLPSYRKLTDNVFPGFSIICKAPFIECQTNHMLQSQLMFAYARNIYAEAILFEDNVQTQLNVPNTLFKKHSSTDEDAEYVLEHAGQVVAAGGFVRNYNFPYIDMYYEVKEEHRRRGFGSLITQELKREAYRLMRFRRQDATLKITLQRRHCSKQA